MEIVSKIGKLPEETWTGSENERWWHRAASRIHLTRGKSDWNVVVKWSLILDL